MNITLGRLHHYIINYIIDHGYAPSTQLIGSDLALTVNEVEHSLQALQDYHGVVLHPNCSDIWAIHPFSNAPTSFNVSCKDKSWWANCAWCALGVAAILKKSLRITTTLCGESKQVVIDINNGELSRDDLYVHFPIAMTKAWDNVIYTCSTMLLFENPEQVDDWCRRHNIPKGDVQPIEKIWQFSKVWYGNHAAENWQKLSLKQAKQVFQRFELTHEIWQLPDSDGRF